MNVLSRIGISSAVMLVMLVLGNAARAGEIHEAASKGVIEKVQGFLKANPELANVRDRFGYTPLLLAAMNGHKNVIELLLSYGAQVNARDNDGNTPLDLATLRGHEDVANLLGQQYQFTVIKGFLPENVSEDVLKNDPDFLKRNQVMLCETVILNQPFRFDVSTNYTSASGLLRKSDKGKLHFKGDVQVATSGTQYDTDIELGKGYETGWYSFSGGIVNFFVKFDNRKEKSDLQSQHSGKE